jgi:hypothetical protein
MVQPTTSQRIHQGGGGDNYEKGVTHTFSEFLAKPASLLSTH